MKQEFALINVIKFYKNILLKQTLYFFIVLLCGPCIVRGAVGEPVRNTLLCRMLSTLKAPGERLQVEESFLRVELRFLGIQGLWQLNQQRRDAELKMQEGYAATVLALRLAKIRQNAAESLRVFDAEIKNLRQRTAIRLKSMPKK
jgi:hypothetical protein